MFNFLFTDSENGKWMQMKLLKPPNGVQQHLEARNKAQNRKKVEANDFGIGSEINK